MLHNIGLKYLEDCPIQPKIPIYLLVGGCFGLLKLLSLLLNQVTSRHTDVTQVLYRPSVTQLHANELPLLGCSVITALPCLFSLAAVLLYRGIN